MYSVCVMTHLTDCGIVVIPILEEPLLGELSVGQGLCEGLDISLHEDVVLGLTTCVEVGFVSRAHLFFGGVRSVTTALKVVEEVQEEMQEVKMNEKMRKWKGREESRSKSNAHHVMTMR